MRALVIDEWGTAYGLSGTQKGEIFGAGLWPFAISIILGSLIIDKVGYGVGMAFAFVCHVLSAVVTILAPDRFDPYWSLYVGNVIVALGNGAVEAVINPVVATLFPREKTKWLNILHAGWPGGLVLGGVIVLGMDGLLGGETADGALIPLNWRYKVALIFLPTVVYGAVMLACKFPVNERVAAGVSYRDMLAELGWAGAFIVSSLIFLELTRVAGAVTVELGGAAFPEWTKYLPWVLAALTAAAFGVAVGGAFGNPLVVVILLIMVPLATTELGTDSWITSLMEPVMKTIGVRAGWVLVYTSAIMMVLRFFAGPIVHRISPLGLLAACSAIAAVGLALLSMAESLLVVFLAATVYGVGKTFFWPTTLGVTAEQSPRGGALTLNAVGGTGMLAVGTIGAVFLGYFAETNAADALADGDPRLAEEAIVTNRWVFGEYPGVDSAAIDEPLAAALAPAGREPDGGQDRRRAGRRRLHPPRGPKRFGDSGSNPPRSPPRRRKASRTRSCRSRCSPCLMLVAFLGLLFYFKSRGGYAAVELTESHGGVTTPKDDELGGAVPGPVR